MAAKRILAVDLGLLEKSEQANERWPKWRPQVRVVDVYVEVQDARYLAEGHC
jgi:hypothetical protein